MGRRCARGCRSRWVDVQALGSQSCAALSGVADPHPALSLEGEGIYLKEWEFHVRERDRNRSVSISRSSLSALFAILASRALPAWRATRAACEKLDYELAAGFVGLSNPIATGTNDSTMIKMVTMPKLSLIKGMLPNR